MPEFWLKSDQLTYFRPKLVMWSLDYFTHLDLWISFCKMNKSLFIFFSWAELNYNIIISNSQIPQTRPHIQSSDLILNCYNATKDKLCEKEIISLPPLLRLLVWVFHSFLMWYDRCIGYLQKTKRIYSPCYIFGSESYIHDRKDVEYARSR